MTPLRLFFTIAIGTTWLLQLPALLAKFGVIPGGVESWFGLAALGGFGPLVATIAASKREGPGTLGRVYASLKPSARQLTWGLVAFAAPIVIHLVGVAAWALVTATQPARWLYLPDIAQHWIIMVVVSSVEEPAWRGFALPRLQDRHGRLRASLILGGLWAAWHVVMFVLQGFSPLVFAIGLANIFAGSILFSWLYNRAGGSLFVALVAHMGAHFDNPTHALPDVVPFFAMTGALCVVSIALLFDRAAWVPAEARGEPSAAN